MQSHANRADTSFSVITKLAHGLPLVTRNVGDFQGVPDLQIINPFAA